MSQKDNPEFFCKQHDFLALTGSRLYGYATEKSDADYRGFVLPPTKYLLGIENFNFYQFPNTDHIIFSLKHFIDITLKGNTQTFEILFSNDIQMNWIGRCFHDNRSDFFSQRIIRSTMGFALSEWRKTLAQSLIFKYNNEEQKDLLTKVAGKFQLRREEIQEIYDIIYRDRKDDPRSYTPTLNIGEKAKEDINKYGYQLKPACNTIRLLYQAIEFGTDQYITFPRPESEILRNIRLGKYSLKEVQEIYDDASAKLTKVNMQNLPEKPKTKFIWEAYEDIVKDKIIEENES